MQEIMGGMSADLGITGLRRTRLGCVGCIVILFYALKAKFFPASD
jgi:hypothetical protein